MKKFVVLLILLVSSFCYADIILSDEEYQAVILRLKKDKEIIHKNESQWNSLKTSKPEITYQVLEEQVVIQQITIPINNNKPLIYKVKFKVEKSQPSEKLFPFSLFLCGMLEKEAPVDSKIGVKLIAIPPLYKNINIGVNGLVGIKSFGSSLSFGLPKPFKNTALHIYYGYSYKKADVYGVGISLNF